MKRGALIFSLFVFVLLFTSVFSSAATHSSTSKSKPWYSKLIFWKNANAINGKPFVSKSATSKPGFMGGPANIKQTGKPIALGKPTQTTGKPGAFTMKDIVGKPVSFTRDDLSDRRIAQGSGTGQNTKMEDPGCIGISCMSGKDNRIPSPYEVCTDDCEGNSQCAKSCTGLSRKSPGNFQRLQ